MSDPLQLSEVRKKELNEMMDALDPAETLVFMIDLLARVERRDEQLRKLALRAEKEENDDGVIAAMRLREQNQKIIDRATGTVAEMIELLK